MPEDGESEDLESAALAAGGEHGEQSVVAASDKLPLPRRFAGFLRGCWRELQRVQWPDRGQVAQATGVVIGFVIVAGLFLGGADWVSQKLITLMLK